MPWAKADVSRSERVSTELVFAPVPAFGSRPEAGCWRIHGSDFSEKHGLFAFGEDAESNICNPKFSGIVA